MFLQNVTLITGTLLEDLGTFMIICRWVLLVMRNISDKIFAKIKTHILRSMFNNVSPKIVPLMR